MINPVTKGKSECLRVLGIKFTATGTELPKKYSTVIDMEYSHYIVGTFTLQLRGNKETTSRRVEQESL